ncbi:hypothetical protein ACX3UO_09825 [Corynebacterium coyleae]
MKKIAAATLAATMALSLGAVDANAASNTMTKVQGRNACNMTFDKPSNIEYTNGLKDPVKVKKLLDSDKANNLIDSAQTSSKIGEAFGSSDETSVNDANNLAITRPIGWTAYESSVPWGGTANNVMGGGAGGAGPAGRGEAAGRPG